MHKKTPKASPQKPQSRSSMEASADAPSEVLAELQRATEHACPPKAGSVGGGTRAGATLAQVTCGTDDLEEADSCDLIFQHHAIADLPLHGLACSFCQAADGSYNAFEAPQFLRLTCRLHY